MPHRHSRRFNAAINDPSIVMQQLGGADAAIVTAAFPRPFEQALAGLRRGGRLVMVGLPAENNITLPIFQTVLNGISVIGSIVGTRLDLAEVGDIDARVVFDLR